LAQTVWRLRPQDPRGGTDTLVGRLRREGQRVSTSRGGWSLVRLKAHGSWREPPHHRIVPRRRPRHRPDAIRQPTDDLVQQPGDLVQVDPLDVRPRPGLVCTPCTARDVLSRWDVLELHTRATAASARDVLDTLQARRPFALQALPVDGGRAFAADVEPACRARRRRLFVLPPRSPKLTGSVERAQRTPTEECYEVRDAALTVPALNQALQSWERTDNTVRPHQALGYQTPQEFVRQWQRHQRLKCHSSTGRVQAIAWG